MGTALGFAITQPPVTSWVVFTCLGLGMAMPFLLLSIFPQWLGFLPKPGHWMNILKIIFGFVLLLCVVWLGWVLNLQKGVFAIVTLMIGLAVIGTAAVAGGLFQRQGKRLSAILVFLLFVSGGVMFIVTGLNFIPEKDIVQSPKEGGGILWQKFSSGRLAEIRREERPVFIDFTAAWCLTCQVNERVALYHPQVVGKFQQLGVVAVKADWTRQDEKITKALSRYGKNSIPVYVLYSSDPQQPPKILPEILTPQLVIEALEEADGK